MIINETYPNSNGYKGWFKEYPIKFGKEDEENFNFDFSKEKDIIALIFLATAWNVPNYRWENAVGLVAVLYKKNLLEKIDNWNSQKEIESLDKNDLVREMNNFRSTFLGDRGNLYIKSGKDGVFERLRIVAKEYNFLKETLQIDNILEGKIPPKLDHNIFPRFDNPRLMIEVKRKNNKIAKSPILRVKVPLILRELKCQNRIDISGEYCCVPDTKVKQMMKTIGYNPSLDCDYSSVIYNSKIIYKYFGLHYDLPLFDFFDECSKMKNKECNNKCVIFDYCAKL